MAIFESKLDRDISLLTQWYQLTPCTTRELTDFFDAEAWGADAPAEPFVEMAEVIKREALRGGGEWHRTPITKEMATDLVWLHGFVRRLLDAWADDTDIMPEDKKRIAELLRESPSKDNQLLSMVVTNGQEAAAWDEGKAVPARSLRLFLFKPPTGTHAKARLIEELTQALRDQEIRIVTRCPQCGNPFLTTRQGKKFCSHRCANRAGDRERRQEKKNVLVKA